MKNWFDHIMFHTRAQPEKPAMVTEDRVVTYRMLLPAIESCAHRLAGLNIAGDGVVAILVANPIRHITLCLALYRIGIATMSLEHGQSGINELKFTAALSDGNAIGLLDPANRVIEVGDAWFGNDSEPDDSLPAGFYANSQICRHSLTSGATGTPKIIKHTVEDVGRRIPPFIELNWDFALCMPGLSSNWGFTTSCAVLATGRTLCFAVSPYQAIRMIELFSIDFVMASTEQLLAMTRVARKSGAHVKSLRNIWFGGTVPSRALIEAATIHLCRNILCRYAGSELGHMAQATASEVLSHPGLVGHVVPGIEIAIIDPRGDKCPPGQIGIVKARLKDDPAGPLLSGDVGQTTWADLGDLGWVTADGLLYIVGRTADVAMGSLQVVSAPQISSVYEVEQILRLEWDTADAAAVLLNDQVEPQIWIGMIDGKDANAEKLSAILRAKGINIPVRLFDLQFIPRGSNGKVNRAQLKSLMLSSVSEATVS